MDGPRLSRLAACIPYASQRTPKVSPSSMVGRCGCSLAARTCWCNPVSLRGVRQVAWRRYDREVPFAQMRCDDATSSGPSRERRNEDARVCGAVQPGADLGCFVSFYQAGGAGGGTGDAGRRAAVLLRAGAGRGGACAAGAHQGMAARPWPERRGSPRQLPDSVSLLRLGGDAYPERDTAHPERDDAALHRARREPLAWTEP